MKRGILTVDEYRKFFDEMCQKYDSEDVRIMYQNKLDIYIEQKGDTLDRRADHMMYDRKKENEVGR